MGNKGRYGRFGGQYVPETLMPPLIALEEAYDRVSRDRSFITKLETYQREYAGRPTPLTYCENTSRELGCRVYLKREDLLHGGAHKLNNTLGQALLAKYMGKERIIAETGAGQHGVATAIAGALLGIPVEVYMGSEDVRRQALNVERMNLLGARVLPVEGGSRTLKDAVNEALRDWAANVYSTHYLIGSIVGPHPYPRIVRDFQAVIGREARAQVLAKEGRLPDAVVACVGGGSNAIGIFSAFESDPGVRLIGVEAGGTGERAGEHSATLCLGSEGVLHGALSLLLQDVHGQIEATHSVAAGLDYPGVGPELAYHASLGRIETATVRDEEALAAFSFLARREGIIPALESSHAIAHARKVAPELGRDGVLVINLSGRGDKDAGEVMARGGGNL